MATNEMIKKIEELQELEAYIEEVKAEAEAIRDEIKQTMLDQDTEELTAGQYIVRWTSVLTNRFDTTAFKKALPEVYKAYTKQSASRRFSSRNGTRRRSAERTCTTITRPTTGTADALRRRWHS